MVLEGKKVVNMEICEHEIIKDRSDCHYIACVVVEKHGS